MMDHLARMRRYEKWRQGIRMQSVRNGSRGFEVMYLQRLLNLRNNAGLREDGAFGPRTEAGLKAWQRSKHTPDTGVADAMVFQRLGMTVCIEHPIQLFGQPTGMTCWSASMTMLRGTNMSVGPGSATLGATGGLQTTQGNVETFARENGFRVLSSMRSYTINEMENWIRPGALLAIGSGQAGPRRFAHACVISGFYSDQNPNGSATMLRIHDPEPVGQGSIGWAFFGGASQWTPMARYDLFGAFICGR